MSTSQSPVTIRLPAHILDAHISPRAREVLMLLASQTTEQDPTVWVCHAAIAERLRCSAITVKRAIQKLVEAKLIDETGDLHERKYKFYCVKWCLNEKPTKKAPNPVPANIAKPVPAPQPPMPTLNQMPISDQGGLAPYMERARLRHEEFLRRYQIKPGALSYHTP